MVEMLWNISWTASVKGVLNSKVPVHLTNLMKAWLQKSVQCRELGHISLTNPCLYQTLHKDTCLRMHQTAKYALFTSTMTVCIHQCENLENGVHAKSSLIHSIKTWTNEITFNDLMRISIDHICSKLSNLTTIPPLSIMQVMGVFLV